MEMEQEVNCATTVGKIRWTSNSGMHAKEKREKKTYGEMIKAATGDEKAEGNWERGMVLLNDSTCLLQSGGGYVSLLYVCYERLS